MREALCADYAAMAGMAFGVVPSLDEVLATIERVETAIIRAACPLTTSLVSAQRRGVERKPGRNGPVFLEIGGVEGTPLKLLISLITQSVFLGDVTSVPYFQGPLNVTPGIVPISESA